MKLSTISALIAAQVELIPDAVYYRATDTEANKDIDNIDLSGKTIVLFNNLPSITSTVATSGYVTQDIPISIKVLKLASFDDREVDSDILRDDCKLVAEKLFNKITNSQDINIMPPTLEYTIEFMNQTKIYDKTVTGCTLSFTISSDRGDYNC